MRLLIRQSDLGIYRSVEYWWSHKASRKLRHKILFTTYGQRQSTNSVLCVDADSVDTQFTLWSLTICDLVSSVGGVPAQCGMSKHIKNHVFACKTDSSKPHIFTHCPPLLVLPFHTNCCCATAEQAQKIALLFFPYPHPFQISPKESFSVCCRPCFHSCVEPLNTWAVLETTNSRAA